MAELSERQKVIVAMAAAELIRKHINEPGYLERRFIEDLKNRYMAEGDSLTVTYETKVTIKELNPHRGGNG
jgi:hypothetical protein